MKTTLLLLTCAALSASASPAKDLLAKMKKSIPADPLGWIDNIIAHTKRESGTPHILVAGDSWADVVGGGGSIGKSFLMNRLKAHGCTATSSCIAIPGTEAREWANAPLLTGLKAAAKTADYVYIMLGGNDALDMMPDCAKNKTKSAKDCGDVLMVEAWKNMLTIVDAIHEVNPSARVVGFGYDTMFGAKGCGLISHDVFPQCWSSSTPAGQGNRCFNTQFLRIQELWDSLAGNRTFVDHGPILGATQVAGGDTKASTDPNNRHIDMDAMGPAKYWPASMECFHPSVSNCGTSVNDCGATVVMEEFYKSYWSKQPMCSNSTVVV